MEIHHERVQGDGVELHVARAGAGPAVILLHGFPEDWRCWRHQIPALVVGGFSVWAVDLRGYNLSERPAGCAAYHLRHLVEDVAAVVRATGQSRAHIVGHDWGGIVAWTFAGVHPELTERLIILNAPHMRIYQREARHPPQMFQSWYVLFFQLPRLPELALSARDFRAIRQAFKRTPAQAGAYTSEEIDGYIEALSQPGALTAALNYYRANFRPGALKLASSAQIAAETLVIWGEKDFALNIRLLDGLEQVAPQVRIHRIPTAGHWIHHEAPEEVSREIIQFLRS